MSRIRILEDHVINQIAAGEVIERPVAVVKELLENSLDAGASRIEIEYKNGGKSYIRIEDNGSGMSKEESLLCLERHATSKLRIADDLLSVRSLGFRGEAIPSIASVSRFTLRTRNEQSVSGVELFVNAGKFMHQQDCGMPVGTRIEVAHLFNSVPARRKFLKTDNTESAHIVHMVRLYAMAYPHCAFKLIDSGRMIFQTSGQGDYQDRIREIWGAKRFRELMEVKECKSEDYPISFKAMIGKPGVARSTRQDILCMVNGRPVDSRTLSYALIESFHTYIPKGRYPVGYLMIEIDPAVIDVNIHPAKRELRFRDEGKVRHFIIRNLLDSLQQAMQESFPQQKQVEPISQNDHKPVSAIPSPAIVPPAVHASVKKSPASPRLQHVFSSEVKQPSEQQNAANSSAKSAELLPSKDSSVERTAPDIAATRSSINWRFISMLKSDFALFENEEGLVILHMRAALQRIYFDQIVQEFSINNPPVQTLLLPVSWEPEPRLADLVNQSLGFLQSHGFDLEEFGRGFYRLSAVPQWLDAARTEEFLTDLFYVLREEGMTLSESKIVFERLARLASNYAKNFSTKVTPHEAQNILESLLASSNPFASPVGKSTYWQVSLQDLNKKFSLRS